MKFFLSYLTHPYLIKVDFVLYPPQLLLISVLAWYGGRYIGEKVERVRNKRMKLLKRDESKNLMHVYYFL